MTDMENMSTWAENLSREVIGGGHGGGRERGGGRGRGGGRWRGRCGDVVQVGDEGGGRGRGGGVAGRCGIWFYIFIQ